MTAGDVGSSAGLGDLVYIFSKYRELTSGSEYFGFRITDNCRSASRVKPGSMWIRLNDDFLKSRNAELLQCMIEQSSAYPSTRKPW